MKNALGGAFSVVLVFVISLGVFVNQAKAASLTALSDTQSRVKKDEFSNHTIRFTSPTGAAEVTDTIIVTFPSDFDATGLDFGDVDLSYGASTGYENEATLAGSAGAATWGAAFSGTENRVLTLTYPSSGGTAITAGWKVVVEIGTNASGGDTQIDNPTTAANYVIAITGTFGDTGQIATAIVDDDQVVVSTTIDPYLTFTLSQNTVSLTRSGGVLNPDSSNTGFNNGTANTLAAATNATSGYTITYYGATLTSGANTIDAMGTKTTSSTGTEQFGINLKDNATPNTGAEPSGGTGAPASDYNTADEYRFIADTTTNLATASAATASTTFTVSYIVNVAATTQAGAYSTTITYICTGNF
ncbi:MAG: hypothetical protein IPJ67_05335 [Candidatus Moraniibacteriota bacterium]|nr:MAG: hypothetical protein IPJ67_05335 [Candidatus Moranbacteria bacterium]